MRDGLEHKVERQLVRRLRASSCGSDGELSASSTASSPLGPGTEGGGLGSVLGDIAINPLNLVFGGGEASEADTGGGVGAGAGAGAAAGVPGQRKKGAGGGMVGMAVESSQRYGAV